MTYIKKINIFYYIKITNMFESMQIRILIGVVVVVFGIMLLKFLSGDQEKIVEYKAPTRRQEVRSNLKKNNLKPKEQKHVTFAPSAVDATMVPYGSWDTNRNSESGIMNQLNNVSLPTSGAMSDGINMPSALPSIPLLGFSGEDDIFGSDL